MTGAFLSVPGQRPIVAAFVESLLLGISTTIGIAVREVVDNQGGDLSNFILFVVIVAVHFAVLSGIGLLFGYGGGMIAAYPAKEFHLRHIWWIYGEKKFSGVDHQSLLQSEQSGTSWI